MKIPIDRGGRGIPRRVRTGRIPDTVIECRKGCRRKDTQNQRQRRRTKPACSAEALSEAEGLPKGVSALHALLTFHALQSVLRAGEVVSQPERRTIFLGGSLTVTLLFKQLSQHVVDFEPGSSFRSRRAQLARQHA